MVFVFDIQFNFKAHTAYKMIAIASATPLYNNAIILEDVTSIIVDSSYSPNPKIQDTPITKKIFLCEQNRKDIFECTDDLRYRLTHI